MQRSILRARDAFAPARSLLHLKSVKAASHTMDSIAFPFVRFVLFVLLFIPNCLFLAAWGYCAERWHLAGLTWAVCILALVYIVAAAWFANRTALHYVFEERNLRSSIRFAFDDARLRLASLPRIGHWFMPKDQEDVDDEADNAS
jgi:hypothetical protein